MSYQPQLPGIPLNGSDRTIEMQHIGPQNSCSGLFVATLARN
ncbi:MAG TPA: hypothetical protein V6D25_24755 [Leptolyngbyaceae cyanobacterium]